MHKPCPFCRSDDIAIFCFDYSGGDNKSQAVIACMECDAEGPRQFSPTDDEAIAAAWKAWDTRKVAGDRMISGSAAIR